MCILSGVTSVTDASAVISSVLCALCQVSHLSLIGGSSIDDCVARVMERLLNNNLVHANYTYCGRSDRKQAFASLTLKSVVVGE